MQALQKMSSRQMTTVGFLPGTFFQGGKIYCYANFSIVLGPDFMGEAKVSEGVGKLPQGSAPCGRKPDRDRSAGCPKNVNKFGKVDLGSEVR